MQSEKIIPTDTSGAALICGAGVAEASKAEGVYKLTCIAQDGSIRWEEIIDNTVVTVGKAALLNVMFASGTQITAWYLGLIDGTVAPTYSVTDTMSSHAGWTENTTYSNATRPSGTFTTTATNSISTAAAAFNINGTATLAGAFLVSNSTKSGTTGTLYSAGSFSAGNRSVLSGDTLNVTYTASC